MSASTLEEKLLGQIRDAGLPEPARQQRLVTGRRFQTDFAWIPKNPYTHSVPVICEVDGGQFVGGRHQTAKGFESDCEKQAEIEIAHNPIYLKVTTRMVNDGRALVLVGRALAAAGWT